MLNPDEVWTTEEQTESERRHTGSSYGMGVYFSDEFSGKMTRTGGAANGIPQEPLVQSPRDMGDFQEAKGEVLVAWNESRRSPLHDNLRELPDPIGDPT